MSTSVVADAFSGLDALGREGRLALAGVLRCPAHRLERASLGDLTDGRHRRRLVAAVVSAIEPEPVFLSLAGRALSELAPAAAALPDGDLAEARCPARLVRPLRQHTGLRWSSVLALRLGDALEWCGVGPRGAAQLLGVTVERGLQGLADRPRGWRDGRVLADLGTLLRDEPPGGSPALRSALVDLCAGRRPRAVRSAASRLLQAGDRAAGDALAGADLARALDAALLAAGEARDQAIFEAGELALGERPALEQLARRLRLSRERVRQLRIRAAERVRAGAADGPECVAAVTAEVRGRLGSATRVADVAALLAEVGADPPATTAGQLVLWLAGPYRPVRGLDGWLATEPDALVATTRQMLGEDGGARLARQAREELAALGVVEGQRDGWLEACGALIVDDMVVSTAGAPGDLLERLLFAAGTPMTVTELAARLPGGYDQARAVLRRDTRFVRWDEVAGSFGLAEWRATAVASNPPAERRRREPAAESAEAGGAAGGVPAIDGRYWLRLTVDEAVLAGHSRAAPAELAAAVGVAPDHRRIFAGRYGPVSLVHDDGGPRLASLRPVALACGASTGDTLELGFSPDGNLTVKLHTGEAQAAEPEHDDLAQGGS
jgi:hypothetical protein